MNDIELLKQVKQIIDESYIDKHRDYAVKYFQRQSVKRLVNLVDNFVKENGK